MAGVVDGLHVEWRSYEKEKGRMGGRRRWRKEEKEEDEDERVGDS